MGVSIKHSTTKILRNQYIAKQQYRQPKKINLITKEHLTVIIVPTTLWQQYFNFLWYHIYQPKFLPFNRVTDPRISSKLLSNVDCTSVGTV